MILNPFNSKKNFLSLLCAELDHAALQVELRTAPFSDEEDEVRRNSHDATSVRIGCRFLHPRGYHSLSQHAAEDDPHSHFTTASSSEQENITTVSVYIGTTIEGESLVVDN